MIASVLSTKKLSRAQRGLLLNAGIGLVEKDFIAIKPLAPPADLSAENLPRNLIVTGRNTVELLTANFSPAELAHCNFFCVGEKTGALLSEKIFSVKEVSNYGSDLAEIIVNNYKDEDFVFFCGQKRKGDLPDHLKQHQVNFNEIHLYDTVFTPRKIDRIFEGVLFFSPSGVKSYMLENSLDKSIAFCIGTTTAAEAAKHTPDIVLAKKPSIENVIVQVIKQFS